MTALSKTNYRNYYQYQSHSWNIRSTTTCTNRNIQLRFYFVLLLVVCTIIIVIINSYHFPNSNKLLFDTIILFNDESRITSTRTTTITSQSITGNNVKHPVHIPTSPVSTDDPDDRIHNISTVRSNPPKRRMSRGEAIAAYRTTVLKTNTSADRCLQQRMQQHSTLTLEKPVLNCLRLTKDNIVLQYPMDAELHYNEIRYKMASFAQHQNHTYHSWSGFAGPWIENHFITHFETIYDSQYKTSCLHQHFGPYIPIFLPWVDHFLNNKYSYPDGFIKTLLSTLRPNVPYITVSQNARGLRVMLAGKSIFKLLPNLLILSGGGHGHVPIPLLKQDEVQNNYIDIRNRTIDISYVGSLGNAPNNVRQIMNEQLMEKYNKNNQTTTNNNNETHRSIRYEYYYGNDWRQYMAQSKLSLVPRGFGRTAYHLVETIQMGLVPIYIHLEKDVPWIPYETLYWKHIGYVTDFTNILNFVEQTLQKLTDEEIRQKEQRIVSLRQSHFSIDGILHQIQLFMLYPNKSDLQCQPLPQEIFVLPKK
jgi:hypothetical protein